MPRESRERPSWDRCWPPPPRSVDKSWALVATGSFVFVAVLGFNLLGRGLRIRLHTRRQRRSALYVTLRDRVAPWLAKHFGRPIRQHPFHAAGALLLLIVISGGFVWWQVQAARRLSPPAVVLSVPGAHPWATARRDSYGTLWSDVEPLTDPSLLWIFTPDDAGKFSGGPAVSAQGMIYVATRGGKLYALTADGAQSWQVPLSAGAVGSPALSAEGTIYVADDEGGLSAFDPEGRFQWRYLSGPDSTTMAGPMVAPDGTIFYGAGGGLQAVSPGGTRLWQTQLSAAYRGTPPQLNPDGTLLFWKELVLNPQDGMPISLTTPVEVSQLLVGADGRSYLRAGNLVIQWRLGDEGAVEIIETAQWDYRAENLIALTPFDAGVTAGRVVWLGYTNQQETKVILLDHTGRVLGIVKERITRGKILAADRISHVYFCGVRDARTHPQAECMATAPNADVPLWRLPISGDRISGGALVPGRLYVVTEMTVQDMGFLHAIGEATAPDARSPEAVVVVRGE